MTEITDAEAAEVLWASSEQGKAAVKAGWDRAMQLGIAGHPVVTGGRPVDMADIGAVVYAAHLAAGRNAGPARPGVPVPDHPYPVRGGCGQNGDGSWATDGHGCPVCGAYGTWDDRSHHGGGIAGSPGCPNRGLVYDYEGNVVEP